MKSLDEVIADRLIELSIETGIELKEVEIEFNRRENRIVLAYSDKLSYDRIRVNALLGTELYYESMLNGGQSK